MAARAAGRSIRDFLFRRVTSTPLGVFGQCSSSFAAAAAAPKIPHSSKKLLQLLPKASQDKKFVCEEADKALTAMKSMAPLLLLQKLRGYVRHGNLKVRAKSTNSISNCVSKMGLEEMKEFGLVPLLLIGAGMLNDMLPDAREAARR